MTWCRWWWRTGAASSGRGRVSCRPSKKILHDDRLDLDALTDWITGHHDAGRPVAVHCVTAAQLVVTVAALRAAGSHPQDRIEHAAVVPEDNLADLADLGVTVVTQPNFVAERGDHYLADVPAAEHGQLWRVASLLKATVPVALSTDMPFGHGDPWTAMRAAVYRTTPSGAVLNANECVSAREALTMFLGRTGPAGPGADRRDRTAGGPLCAERAAGDGAGRAGRRHGGGHHHRRRARLLRDVTGDHRAVASAARKLPHWLSKNRRDTCALGTMRSKPWKAPGTVSTWHGTPAAVRRSA